MMKAIDKSNSPLWVRILVWILVAGLMAASAVGIAAIIISGISGWEEAGQQQPIVITADDLDPEILEQLLQQQQMMEQEEAGQAEGAEGAEQESPPAPDEGEDDE